jgi:hypothetical protein
MKSGKLTKDAAAEIIAKIKDYKGGYEEYFYYEKNNM